MRRRAFLATCAAAGLAGCTSDDSPAGTVADTETPSTTPAGTRESHTVTTARGDGTTATETTERSPTETVESPTETPTPTATPIHSDYETTEVRMTTPDGEVLASVTAAIADTGDLRYLGLSDTEHLPEDRGMLFVYDEVGDRTFVMREMDFGIDIVYADDEGVITTIHHAPAPGPDEDGNEQRYPGRGQYVLEVNYEFTTEHGVEEGDVLEFDL